MISTVDIIASELIRSESINESVKHAEIVTEIINDYYSMFQGVQEEGFELLWDCYSDGIRDRIIQDGLNISVLNSIERACRK